MRRRAPPKIHKLTNLEFPAKSTTANDAHLETHIPRRQAAAAPAATTTNSPNALTVLEERENFTSTASAGAAGAAAAAAVSAADPSAPFLSNAQLPLLTSILSTTTTTSTASSSKEPTNSLSLEDTSEEYCTHEVHHEDGTSSPAATTALPLYVRATGAKSVASVTDVNQPAPAAAAQPPVGATLLDAGSSEVELISLLEEKIPKYKLRFDTITEFTGYQNNDWLIETPLIDLNAPIDLSPEVLRETLHYFILSGERLSQMTRVYNDTDALTKLLEEKERDLELAARIGQTLLDQNQSQNERINELEAELSQARDKIIQLRHEISSKKDLLQIYLKDEEEEEEEEYEEDDDGMLHFSSLQYEALDHHHHQGRSSPSLSKRASSRNAQLMLNKLERRVGTLETENRKLKSETLSRASELEDEERKELALIDECARRLTSTNKQVAALQEDLSRRTEETIKQAAEISQLLSQVTSLEKTIRTLTAENEELESALSLAHECQSELSLELIDVKEKQANLLAAFHEKQEECRELMARRRSTLSDLLPYVDSLAYELEQSSSSPSSSAHHLDDHQHDHQLNHHPLHGAISNLDEMLCDEQYDPAVGFHGHGQHGDVHHLHQCPTPDSLLSNDSFYTSSPFTSFSGPSTSALADQQQHQQQSTSSDQSPPSSDAILTTISTTTLTSSSPCPSPSPSSFTPDNTTTASPSSTRTFRHRHHFLTDKLRYVKPLEGSQTLHQWRRLASPNLNNLFEEKETKGYFSRIKANLAAAEVALYAATSKDRLPAPSTSSSSSSSAQPSLNTTAPPPPTISITLTGSSPTQSRAALRLQQPSLIGANFVTTNSVFTFTTTSVSQTRESVTHVTSTYSSVQSSTGKGNSTLPLSHLHSTQAAHTASGAHTSVTVASPISAGQPNAQAKTTTLTTTRRPVSAPSVNSRSVKNNSKQHNSPQTSSTSTASNSNNRLMPFGGLNELGRLLERDKSLGLFSSALRPLHPLQNGRIMTKVMAAGVATAATTTNELTNKVAKSDFFRTDLSVLRNLRKGGLI